MIYRDEIEISEKIQFMVEHGNRILVMKKKASEEGDAEYASFLHGVHYGMQMMIHELLTFFFLEQFTIIDISDDEDVD